MICPSCGFDVSAVGGGICPTCGRALPAAASAALAAREPQLNAPEVRAHDAPSSAATGPAAADSVSATLSDLQAAPHVPAAEANGPSQPGTASADPPASEPPSAPSGQAGGPPTPGSWPPAPPAFDVPTTPPPGYPPYGQAAPPSAPYGYPPSGYPAYGQATPPSGQMPPWAGYPPGYAPLPPAPRRPDRTPLLVGVLVAVLLLAVGGAVLYLVHTNGSGVSGTGTSLAVATPTSSPTPSPTPAPSVVYQDSLKTGAVGWAEDPSHCFDGSDGYHIENGYVCFAVPAGAQQDFTVTVTVREISGPVDYPYAVDFRINGHAFYSFDVYGNQYWALYRCDANSSASNPCPKLVDFTYSPAIKAGLNVSNTLEVRAQGSQFSFAVNGQQVGHVTDNTYTAGLIGLAAANNMEVVATDMTVAELP